MSHAHVPIGTVPIYQAAVQAVKKKKTITKLDPEELFEVIEKHGEDGVSFITVHCGVTRGVIERLKKQGRIADIVSRGGAFLTEWMVVNNKENPLYEQFDRLVSIAKKYDMSLSLGDGLRPGSVADATDRAQVQELLILGELCAQAQKEGVQVMIEGPGHVPLNQIETNIVLQKSLCKEAPFYVLGPIVTDIAPGYDHITAAIGGALAGYHGADFICYVTPSEHLGLPTVADVREGVVVARIAAHAADLARGNKDAWERDRQMSKYRKALDWEGQTKCAIDPEKIRAFRKERNLHGRRLQHVRRILRHEDRHGVFQEVDGISLESGPSGSSPFPSSPHASAIDDLPAVQRRGRGGGDLQFQSLPLGPPLFYPQG